MRDVMNVALRRMYIACKSRSGFPGTMPAGSDTGDDNVSVQAILEGLGLIPSPRGESSPYDSFDAHNNAWRVTEISKSTTPSQSTGDVVPGTVNEPVPTSLSAQCRTSYGSVVPSPIMVPPVQQSEYHGATTLLSPLLVDNREVYLSYSVDFIQGVPTGSQTHQTPLYQGGLDCGPPTWLESTATPSFGSYDYSYAY